MSNILDVVRSRSETLAELGGDPTMLLATLRAQCAISSDIAACDERSVMAALYAVAQSGLTIGGPQPHVYLIPRGGICTMMLGYRGAVELARRHGGLRRLHCDVIRDGDEYSYTSGDAPSLSHSPSLDRSGRPLAVYAIGWLENGDKLIEVAPWSDVEIVRKKSRSPAWRDWPERMAMRLPLRRLCARLSLSEGARRVLDLSGAEESGSLYEQAHAAHRVVVEVESADVADDDAAVDAEIVEEEAP